MSGTHTPGPWRVSRDCGGESVVARKGMMVADCAIFGGRPAREQSENQANARLIAATPDLLDACRLALIALAAFAPLSVDSRQFITAAIAKATGKAP